MNSPGFHQRVHVTYLLLQCPQSLAHAEGHWPEVDLRLPSSAQRAEVIEFCTTLMLDGIMSLHEAMEDLTTWRENAKGVKMFSPQE